MIVCEANGEIRVSFNFYQHQSRSEFANNKMRIRKIDQNAFWLKSTLCYFYSFHLFIFRWKRLEEESKKTFFVKSDEIRIQKNLITLNEIEVQIRLNQIESEHRFNVVNRHAYDLYNCVERFLEVQQSIVKLSRV